MDLMQQKMPSRAVESASGSPGSQSIGSSPVQAASLASDEASYAVSPLRKLFPRRLVFAGCVVLSATLALPLAYRFFGAGAGLKVPPASGVDRQGIRKPFEARSQSGKLGSDITPARKVNDVARLVSNGAPRHLESEISDFVKGYSDLLKKAQEGDSDAALELFKGIKLCSGIPRNAQALQDLQNQIAASFEGNAEGTARATAFIQHKYQGCASFSETDLSSGRKWLETAARLGNHEARVAYILEGPTNNPDTYYQDLRQFDANAQRYLADELAYGNAEILFAASTGYGKDGIWGPDPIGQYAYLYAYALAKDIKQGPIFVRLQELGDGLTSQGLSTAIEQGESFYSRCCVR